MSELGKIEKTIFLLEYAINEDLRKVITQMLNRGELINDLARSCLVVKEESLWKRILKSNFKVQVL